MANVAVEMANLTLTQSGMKISPHKPKWRWIGKPLAEVTYRRTFRLNVQLDT